MLTGRKVGTEQLDEVLYKDLCVCACACACVCACVGKEQMGRGEDSKLIRSRRRYDRGLHNNMIPFYVQCLIDFSLL